MRHARHRWCPAAGSNGPGRLPGVFVALAFIISGCSAAASATSDATVAGHHQIHTEELSDTDAAASAASGSAAPTPRERPDQAATRADAVTQPAPASAPVASTREPDGSGPGMQITSVESTVAGVATVHGWANADVTVELRADGAVNPATVARTDHAVLDEDGRFAVTVDHLRTGPQTLCIRVAGQDGTTNAGPGWDEADCHRLFVAETTHEPQEVITEKILNAMVRANELFDFESALPDWSVLIAGPSTGAGGHFNPEDRIISIHGTSGRSVDDYVVTILHEVGHAVEREHLDPADRALWIDRRDIDPTLQWAPQNLAPDQRWASPAEDFADAFVVWATNGDHTSRSLLAAQPSTADLDHIGALVADLTR